MKYEVSVVIDSPIELVFDLATNQTPQWSKVVVEDEVIHETEDGGVGTVLRIVTEDRGRRMEFEGEVTHFDPPHASAIRMVNNMLVIESAFRLEDLSGSTRITQLAMVKGRGLFRPVMWLMGIVASKASCKASEDELRRLKKYCEDYEEQKVESSGRASP